MAVHVLVVHVCICVCVQSLADFCCSAIHSLPQAPLCHLHALESTRIPSTPGMPQVELTRMLLDYIISHHFPDLMTSKLTLCRPGNAGFRMRLLAGFSEGLLLAK